MSRTTPAHSRHSRSGRVFVTNAVALLIAVPSLTYFGSLLGAPDNLSLGAQRLMADAAVSLSAAVPSNPYNTLAAQLADKQTQLDARAAQLSAEQSILNSKNVLAEDLGMAGFGLSVFLLILIGLNFYLDMRRRSGAPQGALERKFLVDLRQAH